MHFTAYLAAAAAMATFTAAQAPKIYIFSDVNFKGAYKTVYADETCTGIEASIRSLYITAPSTCTLYQNDNCHGKTGTALIIADQQTREIGSGYTLIFCGDDEEEEDE